MQLDFQSTHLDKIIPVEHEEMLGDLVECLHAFELDFLAHAEEVTQFADVSEYQVFR